MRRKLGREMGAGTDHDADEVNAAGRVTARGALWIADERAQRLSQGDPLVPDERRHGGEGAGWQYRQAFLLPRIHIDTNRWAGRVLERGTTQTLGIAPWKRPMESFKHRTQLSLRQLDETGRTGSEPRGMTRGNIHGRGRCRCRCHGYPPADRRPAGQPLAANTRVPLPFGDAAMRAMGNAMEYGAWTNKTHAARRVGP